MFLGFTASKGNQTVTPTDIGDINSIELSSGTFTDMFATRNTSFTSNAWDSNTIMHALFENTLLAGNLTIPLSEISCLRIKQREVGTYIWKTIYEVPIHEASDFQFSKTYRYCKLNKTKYEFALVPVIGNIEGDYFVNTVISDSEGGWICDADNSYEILFNFKFSKTRSRQGGTYHPLGREKSVIIRNGISDSNSGSITATFFQRSGIKYDSDSGISFGERVNDFLFNGKPKILKHYDGREWMIEIGNEITESTDEHWKMPKYTFSFEEIGDIDNQDEMYVNGFIDVQE